MKWKLKAQSNDSDFDYDRWESDDDRWAIIVHPEPTPPQLLSDCGCRRRYRDQDHYLLIDLESDGRTVYFTLEWAQAAGELVSKLRGKRKVS